MEYYEAKSSVHGTGMFAKLDIPKGFNLGLAIELVGSSGNPDSDYKRTSLGRKVNHSSDPNLLIRKVGNDIHFKSKRRIPRGTELTVDYNSFGFDGERSFTKVTMFKLGFLIKVSEYDPPMKNIPDYLNAYPPHPWRARTGIELIHEEPSRKEQMRIWKNWNFMSMDMKNRSDAKSLELFGMTNKEHHDKLMSKLAFMSKISRALDHIYITGPHGSGKTTLAKRLSKRHNMPILSLDDTFRKNVNWKDAIENLKRPHVVEGTALFMDKKPRSKDIIVLSAKKKELIDRMVNRGWFDSNRNKRVKGEKYRHEATAIVGQSLEDLGEAKRRWGMEKKANNMNFIKLGFLIKLAEDKEPEQEQEPDRYKWHKRIGLGILGGLGALGAYKALKGAKNITDDLFGEIHKKTRKSTIDADYIKSVFDEDDAFNRIFKETRARMDKAKRDMHAHFERQHSRSQDVDDMMSDLWGKANPKGRYDSPYIKKPKPKPPGESYYQPPKPQPKPPPKKPKPTNTMHFKSNRDMLKDLLAKRKSDKLKKTSIETNLSGLKKAKSESLNKEFVHAKSEYESVKKKYDEAFQFMHGGSTWNGKSYNSLNVREKHKLHEALKGSRKVVDRLKGGRDALLKRVKRHVDKSAK